MTYTLVIMFGFLWTLRGSRYAFSQKPIPSFFWIWREATDLFLTLALIAALFALASSFDGCRGFVQEYPILLTGAAAYLLARYQRKPDLFFLLATVASGTAFSAGTGMFYNLSWAWAVSFGIALFQTCFLGLRHKLLFSNVPEAVRGWPVFCLLASFVSLALWGIGRFLF